MPAVAVSVAVLVPFAVLVAVAAVLIPVAVLVAAVIRAASLSLPVAAIPPVVILCTASAQAGNAGAVAAQEGRPVARARARTRHAASDKRGEPRKAGGRRLTLEDA